MKTTHDSLDHPRRTSSKNPPGARARVAARLLVGLLVAGASLAGVLAAPPGMADEMPAASTEVQPEEASAPTDSQVADPHAAGGWHHGMPFAYEEGLLDYVKFPRAWLADHGVNMYLSTLVIGQFIVEGGLDQVDKGSVSYDFQVYLDSAKLGLWKGGYVLVRAEGKTDNAGVNPYTGALIPVNFDAMVPIPEGTEIEATEWWVAQEFFGGKAEALFGMWDIGRFFDLVPFSGPYPYRFLNAHMFFNNVLTGGGALRRTTFWEESSPSSRRNG